MDQSAAMRNKSVYSVEPDVKIDRPYDDSSAGYIACVSGEHLNVPAPGLLTTHARTHTT